MPNAIYASFDDQGTCIIYKQLIIHIVFGNHVLSQIDPYVSFSGRLKPPHWQLVEKCNLPGDPIFAGYMFTYTNFLCWVLTVLVVFAFLVQSVEPHPPCPPPEMWVAKKSHLIIMRSEFYLHCSLREDEEIESLRQFYETDIFQMPISSIHKNNWNLSGCYIVIR